MDIKRGVKEGQHEVTLRPWEYRAIGAAFRESIGAGTISLTLDEHKIAETRRAIRFAGFSNVDSNAVPRPEEIDDDGLSDIKSTLSNFLVHTPDAITDAVSAVGEPAFSSEVQVERLQLGIYAADLLIELEARDS